jgi:hypothetical protein
MADVALRRAEFFSVKLLNASQHNFIFVEDGNELLNNR